jgi:hypothetical protein
VRASFWTRDRHARGRPSDWRCLAAIQGGTSVQADWRALKNLSIVSKIAGQGCPRISIYWRKDFH